MVVLDFKKMKAEKRPISMVVCYDYWTAQILNTSNVDCVLVGDSVAMVMHGHKTTIPAHIEMMVMHTQAVARGAPDKFIIGDMPFLSYRKSLHNTMKNVEKLMHAGANAIKLEGIAGLEDTVSHIVDSGVPVMGHLGLTPQSIHQLGGFRVQAKDSSGMKLLKLGAKKIEAAGCFALVLECVPSAVAAEVAQELSIPVIGIGAGAGVNGQVLVLQDLLGMDSGFKPKFLKTYCNGFDMIKEVLNRYDMDVKTGQFPSKEESY